jgi:hypothetical protein
MARRRERRIADLRFMLETAMQRAERLEAKAKDAPLHRTQDWYLARRARHRAAKPRERIGLMKKNQGAVIEGVDIRELAALCDEYALALGDALQRLHGGIVAARQHANGRGPTAMLVHAGLERCTRLYLGNTVMRGLPGSPRLPRQQSFQQTIEKWLPSLSTSATPPSPLPPPMAA